MNPNPFNAEYANPAARSLRRLRPRLEAHFASYAAACPDDWQTFIRRLDDHFERLFNLLVQLYGEQFDFFYHLEMLLIGIAQSWIERSAELKKLDAAREANPLWFEDNQMLGGVCYVDLFAGDLQGIYRQIPYFKELGLTYLHLMPFFQVPPGENDGGYAVSSYREVNPNLGNMKDLAALASELRRQGISLVVDLVFNHTAQDHEWAQRARTGDPEYDNYYHIFPNRRMPDAYEATLREIFPEEHPGAFTYFSDIDKYVWTTFHSYQWDLNYANPAVFNSMAEEMLALANVGVEVLRLDAVAFIWKELGTNCENLPQAHQLIQAFNCVGHIAAPSLVFKSEAIVHPDEVVRYISPDECQLSYNPLLMALLWNSLATREVRLLNLSIRERFKIDPRCAWVNYVRVHDDIGWTFSDEDAARLGINGYDHRRFLNAFYTGRFSGSFARGLPFQENPKTGDARISGTCASLAGLEQALKEEDQAEVELSIRRILLIHGVILTIGGIPLIYLGDELGTLNDYAYQNDPAKADDSRWVHRPFMDWARAAHRKDPLRVEGRIFQGLRRLIALRARYAIFAGSGMEVMDTGNEHVFGYIRLPGVTSLTPELPSITASHRSAGERALIFANFSESEQTLPANLLRVYGLSYTFTDMLSGDIFDLQDLVLEPYAFRSLAPNPQP